MRTCYTLNPDGYKVGINVGESADQTVMHVHMHYFLLFYSSYLYVIMVQASLAIENNSLLLDEVTAIIDGKRILVAGQDIKEVKNDYEVYELLLDFEPYNVA